MLQLDQVRALIWKETRVLRQDRRFVIFLFLVPTVLALLLKDGIGAAGGGNGADQAVPGFSVMFGFYIITYIGISHYREHAWGAWTIVRASGANRLTLGVGVITPYFLLGVGQLLLMLTVGRVVLGAHMEGSYLALVLLVLATELAIVGIAVTLLNITSSLTAMQQMNQLIVLLLGAIGGALLPIDAMPGWSQALARCTPQFWAVQGLQDVMGGGGIADVSANLAVLTAMGVGLLAFGLRAFDPRKVRRVPLR